MGRQPLLVSSRIVPKFGAANVPWVGAYRAVGGREDSFDYAPVKSGAFLRHEFRTVRRAETVVVSRGRAVTAGPDETGSPL